MIIILKNKGTTLISALFSLSIYLSCLVTFLSFYTMANKRIMNIDQNYNVYITELEKREKNICINEGLQNLIQDLH